MLAGSPPTSRVEPWTLLQPTTSYLSPRPGARVEGKDHRFGFLTDEGVDYVTEHPEMEVWAYSPLIQGSYDRPDRPFPEEYDHPGSTGRREVLGRVAERMRVRPSQVVLAWLLHQQPAIRPIVGRELARAARLRTVGGPARPRRRHDGGARRPALTAAVADEGSGCPGWDSNPHWTVFETAFSADWNTGATAAKLPEVVNLSTVSTPKASRVVIAEDEALIRLDLAEMLAEEGYDVVGQAEDGEKAIAMVEALEPDLVILDIKMPRLDGLAVAERVAAQRIAPVVILTAFSQRDLVERARDAGAMAYLVKPFTKTDLVPAIEMAVSRFAELRQLEGEVHDLGEQLATRKALDRAKGVLQQQLGLTEPESFRWVQKTAMDLRLSMRQVAEGVLEHGPQLSASGEKRPNP